MIRRENCARSFRHFDFYRPLVGTFFLKRTSLIQYGFLRFFSKPAAERAIYRAIARQRARRFVEIGVGRAVRAKRMLAVASRFHDREQLSYAGIDLFEDRPADNPGLPLKLAHQLLRPMAGKLQLVPGDAYSALCRSANTLVQSDIIVVTGNTDDEQMRPAWFFFPRMLHDKTCVFVAAESGEKEESHVETVTQEEISELSLASRSAVRHAA